MPELPEVETIRCGLQKLVGKKIVKVFRSEKKLRINSSLELQGLKGAKILEVNRRARYLIINFSNKKSLIIHLGMSGRISIVQDFRQLKHDHFAAKFNDENWLIFNDPRRFGFVDLVETKNLKTHEMLAILGPEPLSSSFNFSYLSKKLSHKKMNIKTAMMDNKIVVGVGNIYINESLFDARISPLRCASSLNSQEIKALISSIKKIIAKAIDLGGSSISDYQNVDGNLGNFQSTFKIYGRNQENCLQCSATIQRVVQASRSSFFCIQCQL